MTKNKRPKKLVTMGEVYKEHGFEENTRISLELGSKLVMIYFLMIQQGWCWIATHALKIANAEQETKHLDRHFGVTKWKDVQSPMTIGGGNMDSATIRTVGAHTNGRYLSRDRVPECVCNTLKS